MSEAMLRRPLDPRICNVAIDANSLDRPDLRRATAVDRLLDLYRGGRLKLIVPKGVREELQNPRTPDYVRAVGMSPIFTLSVSLNSEEKLKRKTIELELRGNAKSGKHRVDADHLFEASKYCGYFITHDKRILRKAGKLHDVLPPSLTVVTLAKFLEIFDRYEAGEFDATSTAL